MNATDLEKKAEKALIFLHEGAMEHAQARANADYLADWIKVEKARIMALFVGMSNAAAEAEALRHPAYLEALQAKKIADEAWYLAQFKRSAAEAVLDCWRTACSNMRANV